MKKPLLANFSFAHLMGGGRPSAETTQPSTAADDTAEATDTPDDEDDEQEDPDDPDNPNKTEDEQASAAQRQSQAAGKPKKPEAAKAKLDKARAEGASAERQRWGSIFASEHAAGREGLAASLASNSEMTADQIVGVLASAPKGGKGKHTLSTAMAHIQDPTLGPTGGTQGSGAPSSLVAAAQKRYGEKK